MENDDFKSIAELPTLFKSIETPPITTVDEETPTKTPLTSLGNESETHVTTRSGATEPNALNILQITQDEVKFDKNTFNLVLDKVGDVPIVIYSISGATRSGKSYLLNYFIKYFEAKKQQQKHPHSPDNVGDDWINFPLTSHFVWRSGKERETTGMNLWSEPYFVETDNGLVAVLLMDTQGLFDDKTTARQNAIIFSLTALCSSVTIFNVMRQVNEDLLQQIQYFSSYTRMVSGEIAEADSASQEDLYKTALSTIPNPVGNFRAFQNLLMVVRDFEIPEYAHGLHGRNKEPTGSRNNFMWDTFHLKGAPKNCPEENSMVRQEILQNYDGVSVYLLPDPGKVFIREKGSPEEDFLQELKSFIEHLASSDHLVLKRLDGRPCTGTQFKGYIETWSSLVEKSADTFPEVYTQAENAIFMQFTIARDMALSWYTKKVDDLISHLKAGNLYSLDKLMEELKDYEFKAQDLFKKHKKFQHEKFESVFLQQLKDGTDEYWNPRMQQMQDLVLANKSKVPAYEKKKSKQDAKENRDPRRDLVSVSGPGSRTSTETTDTHRVEYPDTKAIVPRNRRNEQTKNTTNYGSTDGNSSGDSHSTQAMPTRGRKKGCWKSVKKTFRKYCCCCC